MMQHCFFYRELEQSTPISRSGDCGERRGHCAVLRRLRLSLSDELTLHRERDVLALGDRANENDG